MSKKKGKSTPGPWTIEYNAEFDIKGSNGLFVGAAFDDDSAFREGEPLANARLMAASPKLLNACIAALSQLTEDRPEYLLALDEYRRLGAPLRNTTTRTIFQEVSRSRWFRTGDGRRGHRKHFG